jgi:hypothetical protein
MEVLGSLVTFGKATKKGGNDGSCTGGMGKKSWNMEIELSDSRATKVDGDVDGNKEKLESF